MHKPITCDFWQFCAALNDWLDQAVINRRKAEVFSMYCAGHSVQFVAGELAKMEHEASGVEPE